MSEFRKNLITNDWVMFAPSRSSRPIELKGTEKINQIEETIQRDEKKEGCPFCDNSDEARKHYISTFQNLGYISIDFFHVYSVIFTQYFK